MAGLGMAAAPAAPAPVAPQQQGLDQQQMPPGEMAEGGEPASPEEQEMYDEIVARAYLLIFDEKSRKPRDSVVKMLSEGEPKAALGQAAATIFFRVEEAAAKAGIKVPGEVKEAAGAEVFSTMAELATKVGTTDFMTDEDAFAGAFYIAANELQNMESSAGMLDEQETSAEFDEIIAADQDGRLAQIVGAA